jgi:hypothetical protein
LDVVLALTYHAVAARNRDGVGTQPGRREHVVPLPVTLEWTRAKVNWPEIAEALAEE